MANRYLLKTEIDLESGQLFEEIVDKLKIRKTDLVKKMIWDTGYEEKIITKKEKDSRTIEKR